MRLPLESNTSPNTNNELLTRRAHGILSHVATLLGLARNFQMSCEELVHWNISTLAEHGYYDQWLNDYGWGNIDAFADNFLAGRSLIYDKSYCHKRNEQLIEIKIPLWFYQDTPEAFFYFDISHEEFSEFAVNLARAHALRCGINLTIYHQDGFETAKISPISTEVKIGEHN